MKAPVPDVAELGDSNPDVATTAQLLEELTGYLRRYIVLDDLYYRAIAAWILHAAAIQAFEITPRLIVRSVVKRAGKSRLLSVIELVLPNASSEINPKPATLVRSIDKHHGERTVLFDEVDQYFGSKAGEDASLVTGVLNSGYERGRRVPRYDVKSRAIEEFEIFAPVAFGSIAKLPDTLEDRGIVIPIRRKLATEVVSRFLRHKVKPETETLRGRIAAWAAASIDHLQAAEPQLPEDLDDRAADIWWPLFCVGDLAGPEYGRVLRADAKTITAARVGDDDSMAIRLLRGIYQVWPAETSSLAGARLTQLLNEDEELPFGGWRDGKGINTRAINKILGDFDIRTKDVWLAESSRKGFGFDQFRDAWQRYLGIRASGIADSEPKRDGNAMEPRGDLNSHRGNIDIWGGIRKEEEKRSDAPYPAKSRDSAMAAQNGACRHVDRTLHADGSWTCSDCGLPVTVEVDA